MKVQTRRCPSCGRPYEPVPNAPYRPFCSERCQLIDLGEWLSENHRIKGDELSVDTQSEDDAP